MPRGNHFLVSKLKRVPFHRRGYTVVKILPNSSFYPMANFNGYIFEHRLIMAQSLNRCLVPNEFVHHLNGVKDDNRIENLRLVTSKEHNTLPTTYSPEYLIELLAENRELKDKIRHLRDEIACLIISNNELERDYTE